MNMTAMDVEELTEFVWGERLFRRARSEEVVVLNLPCFFASDMLNGLF